MSQNHSVDKFVANMIWRNFMLVTDINMTIVRMRLYRYTVKQTLCLGNFLPKAGANKELSQHWESMMGPVQTGHQLQEFGLHFEPKPPMWVGLKLPEQPISVRGWTGCSQESGWLFSSHPDPSNPGHFSLTILDDPSKFRLVNCFRSCL